MRECRLCGQSLEGRRAHARFCSDACRREANRLIAILRSENPGRYGSVHARVRATQNRAHGASGAFLERQGVGQLLLPR